MPMRLRKKVGRTKGAGKPKPAPKAKAAATTASEARKQQKSDHNKLHRQLAQLRKRQPTHPMLVEWEKAQAGGRFALQEFKMWGPVNICCT